MMHINKTIATEREAHAAIAVSVCVLEIKLCYALLHRCNR